MTVSLSIGGAVIISTLGSERVDDGLIVSLQSSDPSSTVLSIEIFFLLPELKLLRIDESLVRECRLDPHGAVMKDDLRFKPSSYSGIYGIANQKREPCLPSSRDLIPLDPLRALIRLLRLNRPKLVPPVNRCASLNG